MCVCACWGGGGGGAGGRFDKRASGDHPPPTPKPLPPPTPHPHPKLPRRPQPPILPLPPPFEEGWTLQDGIPVTKELYDTTYLMIKTMNDAVKTLKPLPDLPASRRR